MQNSSSVIDSNTIDAAETDYLFIKNSQVINAGNGLFTAINLYKDEIIAVFKGEILSETEAENRIKNKNDSYFMNLTDGTILDCMHTDCFAKYANDASGLSKSNFKNNAKITLDEIGNVCLIAIKKIKNGDEIFCDYGKRYWRKHS